MDPKRRGCHGEYKQAELPCLMVNNPADDRSSDRFLGLPLSVYLAERSNEPWSDFEADSFVVGLYIFGKDFFKVASFMETKGVGSISEYYYGRFYGSSKYRKWAEFRKKNKNKSKSSCEFGHRLLVGLTMQQLHARLAPYLADDTKTKLLEVSAAFAKGRTLLETYIKSLKALVGIHSLVKAIAIGDENEDHTTIVSKVMIAKNELLSNQENIPKIIDLNNLSQNPSGHAYNFRRSDTKKLSVSYSSGLGPGSMGKDASTDHLPTRQSTRSRLLSIKAREALEIELLSPVLKQSRKRKIKN